MRKNIPEARILGTGEGEKILKERKINLKSYKIQVTFQSQIMQKILGTPGVIASIQKSDRWSKEEIDNVIMRKSIEQDYAVNESMASVLYSLKMDGRQAYEKRNPLAKKMCLYDDEILLQKEEYDLLVRAFEQFQNSGKNEEELLKRVFEAKEVEVEEKKKGKKK